MPGKTLRSASLALVLVIGCGDDNGTDPPPVGDANCDNPRTVQLSVGQHQVVDPSSNNGCIRLQGADAEYVYALVSGSGTVTPSGVSGGYGVQVGPEGVFSGSLASFSIGAASLTQAGRTSEAHRFHLGLREQERRLAADPRNRIRLPASPPAATPPPVVGSEKKFAVCSTTSCNTFDTVTATARSVRTKVAVYLDNSVPTEDSLTQADLDDLARLFDVHHYPIDRDAFGTESDLDNNSVIIILLTDAVNALTPDCSEGRILGYFFGGDLLDVTGSNHGEVFYAMVPAPATENCSASSRSQTVLRLKPTLIHELQHMISFNQHVLVRRGNLEETWLNEGLSHYAEELGGRLIPNEDCVGSPSCRSQYSSGNLLDAYDFMEDTEAQFMVFPDNSRGTLEERGAVWLFTSWLADVFATDPNGHNVTRGLVQTSQIGATNVAAVTGTAFATLVAEWMLAIYLDDLPGFTPQSSRLAYSRWGFRQIFENNCCTANAAFELAFPFSPVNSTGSGNFQRSGTLRGGSGRHFRASVGSDGLDILVARSIGGGQLDAALAGRVGIVRIQ